ncbi:hypothetical protein V1514DRAFT_23970 [Lipomyces japonicus]|uniref:uncharacterized protein n=1 Tax=Lipomyces japonicus TaxID=56871 RepID=UPI0034CE05B3
MVNNFLPSSTNETGNDFTSPPPLVAMFLVRFDVKKGYVLEWQRTASTFAKRVLCHCLAVTLDMIEFQALPSGLHNSKSDVIYFMHGELYAGVSVYQQVTSSDPNERFSKMMSLGVLVPVATRKNKTRVAAGRFGRSWAHVESLRSLLNDYINSSGVDVSTFENYYLLYGLQILELSSSSTPVSSSSLPSDTALYYPSRRPSSKYTAQKSPSYVAMANDDDYITVRQSSITLPILPKSHPAYSLPELLDAFGPLIFTVWKAAIARERILIIGDVPIEKGCNFVYDISILANIPRSIAELLPVPAYRIRPLFTVGLYDLEYLQALSKLSPAQEAMQGKSSSFYGWIAYTTDKILETKHELFDIVIKLPPFSAALNAAAAMISAVTTINTSRPDSPISSANSMIYHPVDSHRKNASRILYPIIYDIKHPKEHFKSSVRDMRRFQTLENQIGYSIDPRHRWYQQYYQSNIDTDDTALQPLSTTGTSSASSYSSRAVNNSDTFALIATAEITAAADDDAVYNDDPELFFSTKTDLKTEQPSWKQLTWLGFLWWASAGEEVLIEEEEIAETASAVGLKNHDATGSLDQQTIASDTRPLLLDDSISRSSSVAATPFPLTNEESFTYLSPFQDISQVSDVAPNRHAATDVITTTAAAISTTDNEAINSEGVAIIESSKQVAIIGFFHRFTARIFSELSRMIQEQELVIKKIEPVVVKRKKVRHRNHNENHDDQVKQDEFLSAHQTLWVSRIDMLAMGLDPLSESDTNFIYNIVERWWGGQIEAKRDNEFLNSVTFCC